MKTFKEQIWDRILEHEDDVFIAQDFWDIAEHETVKSILNRFVKAGQLMRVSDGLYYRQVYLPKYRQYSLPGSIEFAKAIARKYNWSLGLSENMALNLLGLCTQVPAKEIYISSGPYVKYRYFHNTIIFKHRRTAAISNTHPITSLVIQALKGLGKGKVTARHIAQLRHKLTDEQKRILWKESRWAYAWMHKEIRKICEDVIER